MPATRYRIDDHIVDVDDLRFQPLLASAHRGTGLRPRCLCRHGADGVGVEMYISRVGEKYLLKRMPGTGASHHPGCVSFEPPPELSGLGEVLGSAICGQPKEGITTLALGFALTRTSGRSAPTASDGEADSAHSDGTKLTLRGLLHYLWDEAGLTQRTPATVKQPWATVRREVLRAAADKVTKGNPLLTSVYVPEQFTLDEKIELAARRSAMLMRIAAPVNGRRKLMLVIGDVKDIGAARFGHKMVFKHLPDCPFMVADSLHRRLLKTFAVELGLWEGVENSHLMAIGTFGVTPGGVPFLERVALMVTTSSWIPFETVFDKTLIDSLMAAGRSFRKSLRYNMSTAKPLATLVVTDTDPATACYVVAPGAPRENHQELMTLIDHSDLNTWIWNADADEPIPPVPAAGQSTPTR